MKNLAIWLFESSFAYNFRRWFSQNMRFLQNHKANYGASCKSKNSTPMGKTFCQLQKPYFLKLFLKNKVFSWRYHFFILMKPKMCMKFHKNSFSYFWEKVMGWQWCFSKAPFCLKKGSNNINNLLNAHDQCCISLFIITLHF